MESRLPFLKRLIAPIQQRVLDKHLCVACTLNLDKQKNREPITAESELIICECGRAYVYSRPHRKYRRAMPEEVRRSYPMLGRTTFPQPEIS